METTIITVDQTISTELEKKNITKQVLTDLKKYNTLTIAGLDDKSGYEAVHKARMVCKNTRVLAEKICKAGREDAIKIQKAWIAKEKEIVSEIEQTENYLQSQQDKIDNEKQRIEDEKREAERLRIQNRIDKLTAVGYALDFAVVSTISDEQFAETLAEATRLHQEEIDRLSKIEAEKKAEAERLELQRIEQEKERIRLEAIEREQREREEKIRAEQEAAERKIREEREAIEREKAAIEKAKQDAINEEKRKAELEAAKKEAAERALKEAEEKRVREEQERAERERKLAEENARIEALKPDKEKLKQWISECQLMFTPTVGAQAHKVACEIQAKFQSFNKWANDQIDSIQ